MDTAPIKAYAPQARKDFIQAVTERANLYGIFGDDNIEPMQIKGDVAIIADRAFAQSEGELREQLVRRVKSRGFNTVLRAAAYTWFNRFAALRYMELHHYLGHGLRVLSHPEGLETPQILEHAAELDLPDLDRDTVVELKLAGNKDNELYRLIILAQCSALHKAMPFLFEQIDSETALLLPNNLLHTNSPVRKMATALDEAAWQEVEIIGWLYQHYISERKDQVIGKVVQSEDIPAATQLFTPNWIVKYMVQNTLGRMWLATYPDSHLRDKMEYYIEPAEQEPEVQQKISEITPTSLNPEEITFLDPACGSGHILVEAYALFKEIYLERGYRTRDIPKLILEKNLYGLDIDDRAAQMAGFAVLMKAREDDRRVLGRGSLSMNIMAIQEGTETEKWNIGLFFKGDENAGLRADLNALVELFRQGKTLGSLISVPEELTGQMEEIERRVNEKIGGWRFGSEVRKVAEIVTQASFLSEQYDCVVTNPPYMGGKGMNSSLKNIAKIKYPNSKPDTFAMFTEKSISLVKEFGGIGLVMPYVWMFLSSYETFRKKIINSATLSSLVQLEYNAFEPACVPVATLTLINCPIEKYKGDFIKLSEFKGHQNQGPKTLEAIQNPSCGWRYQSASVDFKKIPGYPVAYWALGGQRDAFKKNRLLGEIAPPKQGIATANNDLFLRRWHEVSFPSIHLMLEDKEQAILQKAKWLPYNKGGEFRKWYGNNEFIINWGDDGRDIRNFCDANGKQRSAIRNPDYYFRPSVTWTDISSSSYGVRQSEKGFLFDGSSHSAFPKLTELNFITGLLCSKTSFEFLKIINPTMHFQVGNVASIPVPEKALYQKKDYINEIVQSLVEMIKIDWDSFETSWDFKGLPILFSDYRQLCLDAAYKKLSCNWKETTKETKNQEELNNHIFIEAYNLQDELTPEVPLSEITLTCNPHYRYGGNKTEEVLETMLRTDTIKELISYTVGCMMGRYSLDEPGLIYAHAGNEGFDPSRYATFSADEDGIVPIMDQDWFEDDATHRIVEFIKTAWPAEHLERNLAFIAQSLNPKAREESQDTIRRYISTTFFKDHLKTYKKRPIYWLFSSGKQKAFECLVYLHRYNAATLSRMRSLYVTPLQGNFIARLDYLDGEEKAADTTSAKNKIRKEIAVLKKKQAELTAFDEQLRHYADMRIGLDLDDGVKVNYAKFGTLLAETKAITGRM